jgi:hypothetical protein
MKIITNAILPMKSVYLLAILWVLPLSIFSQSTPQNALQIDARLYEIHDKEYLEAVKKEDPFFIHRWNFYLDNAFFIADNDLSKKGNTKDYPSVTIPDLKNINIMKIEREQDLKHDFYTETIFKIEGTDKYLVYYPGRDFVEKLNEYLKQVKK